MSPDMNTVYWRLGLFASVPQVNHCNTQRGTVNCLLMDSNLTEPVLEDDDMHPEYDFSSGVRGKYARAYREGYTITIHQEDGTTVTQHFKPDADAIILEPDVQEYFPDSEAVNRALRSLIALIPQKRKRSRTVRKASVPGPQRQTASGDSPRP